MVIIFFMHLNKKEMLLEKLVETWFDKAVFYF